MRLLIFLLIVVLSSTAGELAITHGMKKVGGPEPLTPRTVLAFLGRALGSGWFWLGIPLSALYFYAMLALLSWAPVSLIVPATALSYVVGTFGAKLLLGEHVSPRRWAGVALVCAGVALAWVA
jgi:drug/metabolite transporter (DMT)-like permease